MKKISLVILLLFLIPNLCLAQAGDHDKQVQAEIKKVYNKIYPPTKKYGTTTLQRYKGSTVYYNKSIYPTGPPKWLQEQGDNQLYRRELRRLRKKQRSQRY